MRRTRIIIAAALAAAALTIGLEPAEANPSDAHTSCRIESTRQGSDTDLAAANITGHGEGSGYGATVTVDEPSLVDGVLGAEPTTTYSDGWITAVFTLEGPSCARITYELQVFAEDADPLQDAPIATFAVPGDGAPAVDDESDPVVVVANEEFLSENGEPYAGECVLVIGTTLSSQGAVLDQAPNPEQAAGDPWCSAPDGAPGTGTSFH